MKNACSGPISMRTFTVKRLSTMVAAAAAFCILRGVWRAFSNPPGIPSPPICAHEGDSFVDRYIKRFFLQHFYVVRREESLFRLLRWTFMFNHRPFLMRIFFRRHTVISRAEDLEEVLLHQESKFYKRSGYDLLRVVIGDGLLGMGHKKRHQEHRRILAPVFSSNNVKGLADETMRLHVLRLLGTLFELVLRAGDGVVTINFSDYMHRMALDIVSEAAFRASRRDSAAVLEAFSAMTRFQKINYFCPYLRTRGQREAHAVLMRVSAALMQQSAENEGPRRHVVLDALIDEFHTHLSTADVVNHLITFLFAGHDTTSNTMCFLFALLARDEQVQERLYEELVEIMPMTCTCPGIEELLKCDYLIAIVRECMRLFPAAPLLYRDTEEDVYLPASDVVLPKGSVCVLNIFGVHRSTNIYGADADKFRPERWLGDEGKELNKRCGRCGYIPFSAGKRNCIGQEYAYYEVLITTATIFRHLRLEAVGSFPRTHFMFTLSSPDPCRAKLILRRDVSRDAVMKNVRAQ